MPRRASNPTSPSLKRSGTTPRCTIGRCLKAILLAIRSAAGESARWRECLQGLESRYGKRRKAPEAGEAFKCGLKRC